MLKLERVTFGHGVQPVLKDFDFSLSEGEGVCLFGPSGLGKTTILLLAAGLLKPWQGRVWNGFHRLGYVFQDDRLLPWLNARENIVFSLSGYFTRAEAERRAAEWLDRFGMGDAAGKLPGELSGGMRKRVNLARALACEPDCLFLDEAFTFLDVKMVSVALDAIRDWRLSCHGAILAVSHDKEVALSLGAKLVYLDGPPLHLRNERN